MVLRKTRETDPVNTPTTNRGVNSKGIEMATFLPGAKLQDCAVDWMTLVTKDPDRATEWREAFRAVATMEQKRGHEWKQARFFGYEGEQCGHVMWGKRHDGALVRLTSSLAHDEAMLFSPDAAHCTRIDLQVTAELTSEHPLFLEKTYASAKTAPATEGRHPKYTLIADTEGGSTLYVGSRSSMRFGRVYDKGIEQASEKKGKLYRWELEIKDVLADQAVAMLVGSADVQRSILAVVGDFFTARGVPVLWTVPRSDEKFSIPRLVQEDAGTLKWFNGPVATAVARLMETIGPEQTLRALLSKWRVDSSDRDVIAEIVLLLGG